ncbi:MAG: peptidylprolyl isomerase [Acidobacteriota bacterium]
MKKSTLTLIAIVVLAVAIGVILFRHSRSARTVAPSPAPAAAPSASASLGNPASLKEKAPGVYWTKFTTTKGDFVIKVTRAWAPNGADRFYNLVKNGFYNGDSFFRVLPGFVVQFGISPDPSLSKVWHDANIPDDPVRESNAAGTVTFATAGPDTRTTQVFINLVDNKSLDAQGFSPFGSVIEGMSVVNSLYSGYGEGAPMGNGPDQTLIQKEGEAYVAQNFPKLDHIKSAVVLQSAPSTDPH